MSNREIIESVEWRNTALRPTFFGLVEAVGALPVIWWLFNIASTPRMLAVGTIIGSLVLLKRYGFSTGTIFRYLRSRMARFFGGGQRPRVRGHEMTTSIDKSNF